MLAHASCTRIHLKKGRDNQRVAKLVDSVRHIHTCSSAPLFYMPLLTHDFPVPSFPQPSMPEAEAPFALTDGGVADV